jgi:hypothetical protein
MTDPKLRPMIGMFHDTGQTTKLVANVASGSERSGFSGPGISCGSNVIQSLENEALSCLNGFWLDRYTIKKNGHGCVQVSNFVFWKIFLYGVYGEVATKIVKVVNVSVADAGIGVHIIVVGTSALHHELVDKMVNISNSLLVGFSRNNYGCLEKSPSLHTCQFSWAWCSHLNSQV